MNEIVRDMDIMFSDTLFWALDLFSQLQLPLNDIRLNLMSTFSWKERKKKRMVEKMVKCRSWNSGVAVCSHNYPNGNWGVIRRNVFYALRWFHEFGHILNGQNINPNLSSILVNSCHRNRLVNPLNQESHFLRRSDPISDFSSNLHLCGLWKYTNSLHSTETFK